MKKSFRHNTELLFWIFVLPGLAILPMPVDGFSFCPLHMMGFKFCPGCGLGKAIHLAFHGEFSQSFSKHPLGIPAIFIILHRIITIFKQNLKPSHNAKYQSHSASISL